MEPEKAKVGDTFFLSDVEHTVAEACDRDDGRWFCTTHGEGFRNQMMKDSHLDRPGPHVMAWMCSHHGAEVP